jgi:hypothetical protein
VGAEAWGGGAEVQEPDVQAGAPKKVAELKRTFHKV